MIIIIIELLDAVVISFWMFKTFSWSWIHPWQVWQQVSARTWRWYIGCCSCGCFGLCQPSLVQRLLLLNILLSRRFWHTCRLNFTWWKLTGIFCWTWIWAFTRYWFLIGVIFFYQNERLLVLYIFTYKIIIF